MNDIKKKTESTIDIYIYIEITKDINQYIKK